MMKTKLENRDDARQDRHPKGGLRPVGAHLREDALALKTSGVTATSSTPVDAALGAAAGVATGAIAGPPGMIVGGLIGAAVGVAAGMVTGEAAEETRQAEADLDETLGLDGGPMGVAGAVKGVPAEKGRGVHAFSAASAGAIAGGATPSDGPFSRGG